MRILILNWRDITHPWAGGAERHIHELAKNWVEWGHQVTILSGGYKTAKKRDYIDGIEIIRLGNTYNIFFLWPFLYWWKLRKNHYDCLIDTAHGISFMAPLFVKLPTILILHHDHKELWKTEFNKLISRIGIFFEKRILPKIYKQSYVFTLSKDSRNHFIRVGYKNVFAIPPGIIRPKLSSRRKFKTPTICYLGRLRKYKRVDLLLNLLSKLSKKSDVRLIILGDGQDRRRLENLCKKRYLQNKMIFKGFVSEKEKYQILSKSWILAFPSIIEGWGLVALEAASCGTPTIAFKVPGLKDAVKEGVSGILVQNEDQYLEATQLLINNSTLRHKLSRQSLDWAKEFRWDKSAQTCIKIIDNMLLKNKSNKITRKRIN